MTVGSAQGLFGSGLDAVPLGDTSRIPLEGQGPGPAFMSLPNHACLVDLPCSTTSATVSPAAARTRQMSSRR